MNDPAGKITEGGIDDLRRMRRGGESRIVWPLVAVATMVIAVTAADAEDHGNGLRNNRTRAQSGDRTNRAIVPHASLPQDGPLIREGELWRDELGHILVVGQRHAFRPERGGQSVIVLENLNLQRIVQRLDDTSRAPVWSVSGVVTEFQGSNYLLIERAIRKGQASLQAAGRK